MSQPEVLVVRTGTANLASVLAGLRRIGAAPRLTDDAGEVRTAPHVVLPGVGAFGAAMGQLRRQQLDGALRERLYADRPTLCVCVGLQLLCTASEESPDAEGLGVISARVTRFTGDVRIPQLGWNTVTPTHKGGLLEAGYAYFANSYKLDEVPAGWHGATAEHGQPFVAALARGNVLACQFHPELSGAFGLALARRWLAQTGAEVAAC
jgi:imidazole glycerol phosphate synthase glutamine amidotransferase subunit